MLDGCTLIQDVARCLTSGNVGEIASSILASSSAAVSIGPPLRSTRDWMRAPCNVETQDYPRQSTNRECPRVTPYLSKRALSRLRIGSSQKV